VTELDIRTAVRRDDTGAVIAFAGELDLVSASAVSEWVDWAIDAGEARIVVDLSEVSFIDSSGLTALVVAMRSACEAGASLTLRSPSRRTLDLLMLTDLDRIFDIDLRQPH